MIAQLISSLSGYLKKGAHEKGSTTTGGSQNPAVQLQSVIDGTFERCSSSIAPPFFVHLAPSLTKRYPIPPAFCSELAAKIVEVEGQMRVTQSRIDKAGRDAGEVIAIRDSLVEYDERFKVLAGKLNRLQDFSKTVSVTMV